MEQEEVSKTLMQFALLLFMMVVLAACTLVYVQRSDHIIVDTQEDVHADSLKLDLRYEKQGKTINEGANKQHQY